MSLLQPWMLFGLVGLAVPIVIHLLARRKQRTIDWGAMLFLEPSPKTRRSIAIDHWLVLFTRMVMLALLVLALSRPWLPGAWWPTRHTGPPREIVVVLDRSGSTAATLPTGPVDSWQEAELAKLIGHLGPRDRVQLIEARKSPRLIPLVSQTDRKAIQSAMRDLPRPGGLANLPAAVQEALRTLSNSPLAQREVIVLADRQRLSWRPDEPADWQTIETALEQATTRPRIWAMLPSETPTPIENVGWSRFDASRAIAAGGQTVRFSAAIRSSGTTAVVARRVWVERNGRLLTEHQQSVRIVPGLETPIDFEITLSDPGPHLFSFVSETDASPADDRVEWVVRVEDGLPCLIVDGQDKADRRPSAAFFLAAALGSPREPQRERPPASSHRAGPTTAGAVSAAVVTPDELAVENLVGPRIVVLANVRRLNDDLVTALQAFVEHGGVVLQCLGDQSSKLEPIVQQPSGNRSDSETLAASRPAVTWETFWPWAIEEFAGNLADETQATTIERESLTAPWQRRFHPDQGSQLCEALARRWGVLVANPNFVGAKSSLTKRPSNQDAPPDTEWWTAARFANGQPALVWRKLGQGLLATYTTSADASWSTLPSYADYVPWWNELLLAISDQAPPRNVAPMIPLQLPHAAKLREPWVVANEQGHSLGTIEPRLSTAKDRVSLLWSETRVPGVYFFGPQSRFKSAAGQNARWLVGETHIEPFVVTADLREADLTPLTAEDRQQLAGHDRLQWIDDWAPWQRQRTADLPPLEIARDLLWLLLLLFAVETFLTRRVAVTSQRVS